MTDTEKEPGRGDSGSVRGSGTGETTANRRVENRLFTADFIYATLANFANAFGMQMLVATLPVYVINLGGSQADAGLVTGALALTALLFRPVVG